MHVESHWEPWGTMWYVDFKIFFLKFFWLIYKWVFVTFENIFICCMNAKFYGMKLWKALRF
jgi:hypothetical protein